MKKISVFALTAMLIGVLGLTACNRKKPTPTPVDPDPVNPGGDPDDPKPNPDGTVTVYLDLGEIGLYEGKKGTDYPEAFVENGVKITGKPGDALPGKDKITSTSGAEFSNWMYYKASDKTGAPTRYDVLPEFNCVLLANWSGGSGTQPVDPPTPPVQGEVTYTVTGLPNWITNDGCVIFAWVWSPSDTGSWKSCSYGDPATSLTFVVDGELDGFLLARCIKGTTEPNWDEKGDNPGRVYNQTNDVKCSSGVYSYTAEWK